MWQDPIIEEIHQIREMHAAKFSYDIKAIVKDYQLQQKNNDQKIVSFSE